MASHVWTLGELRYVFFFVLGGVTVIAGPFIVWAAWASDQSWPTPRPPRRRA